MTPIVKVFLSLFSVVAVGVGGYGIYKFTSFDKKETVSSKLKISLLSFKDEEDKALWEARATSLGSETQDKVPFDLWTIKKDKTDWKEVRSWCSSKLNALIEGIDSKVMFGVEKYCTYQIKDKLVNAIGEPSGTWTTANGVLTGKQDDSLLSDAMKKVKKALAGTVPNTQADTNALKIWCAGIYSKMYQNDQDFKDASTYCVTTTG